jgi:hypothetical protein
MPLKSTWTTGESYNATDQNAVATQVNQNTTDIAGKQASNSNLTAIAALSASNNDVLQRKSGAWTNRTPAQLKTDLAIATGDVSGLSTLLDAKQDTSAKNQNNGYAGLDSGGKVAAAQLPSYVDDVVEYANTAGFPGTGEAGKLYLAIDTGKLYRWGGSVYAVISDTLAIGTTSSTAKAGDYQPAWSDVTAKPAYIGAGASQAAARTAIAALGSADLTAALDALPEDLWSFPYYEGDLNDAPLGWVQFSASESTNDPDLGNGQLMTLGDASQKVQLALLTDQQYLAVRAFYDDAYTWRAWNVYPAETHIGDLLDGKLDNPTGTPNGTKFLRDDNTWATVTGGGGGGISGIVAGTNIDVDNTDPEYPVVSVEALDADDIADGTTHKSFLATERSKLSGIEALADVTDAANVTAAGAEMVTRKNATNGYAGLDGSGLIPSVLLPSYVDDVIEGANLAALPGTGETGKIYVALDTNKTYRWSGSAYVEISPSPGSTDSVTEGSTNLYYTQARADARVTAGITGKADKTTTVSAGTGLTGGGDLSANRSLAVSYGTTAGTAAQGNDSRLSDARTPTTHSHNVVVPVWFEVHATYGTRSVGYGDNTLGLLAPDSFTLTGVVFRGETADASGSSTFEVRKNGTQISGTSKSITAANQWGYDSDIIVSGLSVSISAGDVLRPYISGVGTTPGKGFSAVLIGTKTVSTS